MLCAKQYDSPSSKGNIRKKFSGLDVAKGIVCHKPILLDIVHLKNGWFSYTCMETHLATFIWMKLYRDAVLMVPMSVTLQQKM